MEAKCPQRTAVWRRGRR